MTPSRWPRPTPSAPLASAAAAFARGRGVSRAAEACAAPDAPHAAPNTKERKADPPVAVNRRRLTFLVPKWLPRAAAAGRRRRRGGAAAGGRRRTFQEDAALDRCRRHELLLQGSRHPRLVGVLEAALLQIEHRHVGGGARFQRAHFFRE